MSAWTIELVRGRVDTGWADRLVAFWTTNGALDEETARERLGEVVCVVLADEEVVGACSVAAAPVALVGGRRFWVFRSFVLPPVADARDELLSRTFATLEAECAHDPDAPVGLALFVAGDEVARRPDATWGDPPMLYVGRNAEGAHLWVAYWDEADIAPREWPLVIGERRGFESGPRTLLFEQQSVVDRQAVADFWEREGALDEEEAGRRASEVLLVSIDDAGDVVGTATAYLERNEQLAMDMWHARVFVTKAHRRSTLAIRLIFTTHVVLGVRFASGTDVRARGIILEIENPMLRRASPEAFWRTGYTFIGERDDGAHVRVHWFPRARVPI